MPEVLNPTWLYSELPKIGVVWQCRGVLSEKLKLATLWMGLYSTYLATTNYIFKTINFNINMKSFHGLEAMLVCGVYLVYFSFLVWGKDC